MRRHQPHAVRRIVLITADASVAAAIGWFFARRWVNADETMAWCLTGVTVGVLSALGAYWNVLHQTMAWHRYCAFVTSGSCACAMLLVRQARHAQVSVANILLAAVALFGVLHGSRMLLLWMHRRLCAKKVLWVIAESAAAARELAAKVRSSDWRYEVKRSSTLPTSMDLASEVEAFDALLCTSSLKRDLVPVCNARGKELLVVPNTAQLMLHSATPQFFEDLVVLSIPSLEPHFVTRVGKRMMDLLLGSAMLLICAPWMGLIGIAIVMESKGGALFRQERRGLDGRSFEILKFRTMVLDAESASGPVLASCEDPRVTRLGSWLRASRLDELPQLWNVLRGEMSLVGPRPEREFFARRFDEEFPGYKHRTAVKPGVTGLAQVWGSYTTNADDKLRLDLLYITNASLRLDLQLLLLTLGAVFKTGSARGIASGLPAKLAVSSARAQQNSACD